MAGRDRQVEEFDVLLDRLAQGRHGRSLIFSGLRGVGKTVLLLELDALAQEKGWATSDVQEVGLESDFRSTIAKMAYKLLRSMSRKERMKERAARALGVLKAFNVTTPAGFQLNIDVEAIPGIADTGDSEEDLTELLLEVGEAAKAGGTGAVFLIDEMQNLDERGLAAICMALHRVGQKNLPVALVGAGLPQLPHVLLEAKPYAERLFKYDRLEGLDEGPARAALVVPAQRQGVVFDSEAVDLILEASDGYPFFLQQYGMVLWAEVEESPITAYDVRRAQPIVQEELDTEFFDNRVEKATPAERRYMAAMADLGGGPQRSSEVTSRLGFTSRGATSQARVSLIKKGLIYGPEHGLVDFTVPHFADFMRRRYPLESLIDDDE